jgi:hypothetical protein
MQRNSAPTNLTSTPLSEGAISKDQLNLVKATDTYYPSSKLCTSLSLNHLKRRDFFSQHQDAKAFLLQAPENPSTEEGRILRKRKSQREGELFITPDAFEKLCQSKLQDYLPHRNFFIFRGATQLLTGLQALHLNDNEDAVVIYFDKMHAMSIYLRQIRQTTWAFVVESVIEGDTENYPFLKDIRNNLRAAFENRFMIFNTTRLQNNYYSCTVLALKAAKYFFKHGDDVFPYLTKAAPEIADCRDDIFMLPANKLMPALLKLSDTYISNLSEEQYTTIVSHKQNLTLREYWLKYLFQSKDRYINTAGFFKRYKYTEDLDRILKEEKAAAAKLEPVSDQAETSSALPVRTDGRGPG